MVGAAIGESAMSPGQTLLFQSSVPVPVDRKVTERLSTSLLVRKIPLETTVPTRATVCTSELCHNPVFPCRMNY